MQHFLYDQYSEGIYYPNKLADAPVDQVQALYVGCELNDISVAKYPNLKYLSYFCSSPNWHEVAQLTQLDHFSCVQHLQIGEVSILEILKNNTALRELTIADFRHLISGSEEFAPVLSESDDFGRFPQLTWLQLERTPLLDFPVSLCSCFQLQTLTLSATGLRNVAPELGHLHQLKTLSLSHNQLDTFPPSIATLTQLTYLDLSHNAIGEVPAFVAQLTALRELNLSHCGLTTLPAFLADLPNLKRLEVKGNAFVQLPEALKRLKSKIKIDSRAKALYDEETRKKLEQDGLESAVFTDFGFKLMVLQQLMYEAGYMTPKFDVYAFAQAHTARVIDLEGAEAYNVIPEVKAYFEQLPIPKILLEEITELTPDGGDEIYSQLAPRWSGEEEFFLIHSGKDARLLPNLQKVSSLFLTQKARNELRKLRIAVEDE